VSEKVIPHAAGTRPAIKTARGERLSRVGLYKGAENNGEEGGETAGGRAVGSLR